MCDKLRSLLKKYWNVVIYLLFGVITTVVNYIIYFPLYNIVGLSAVLSNAFAWLAAVFVAFLTNKPFVFKSYDWSCNVVLLEFIKFVGSRLVSGAVETLLLFLSVDVLNVNGNLSKLFISIFVVAVNYIASKFLVFKHRK